MVVRARAAAVLLLGLVAGCTSASGPASTPAPPAPAPLGPAPAPQPPGLEALLAGAMPVVEDLGPAGAGRSPRLELVEPQVPPDPCDSAVVEPLAGPAAPWLAERTGRLVVDLAPGQSAAVVVSAWRFPDATGAEALVAAATAREATCAPRDRGAGGDESFVPEADGVDAGRLEPLTTYGWDTRDGQDTRTARYAWLVRGATALRVGALGTGGAPAPDVRLLAVRVHNRVLPLDERAVPPQPTGGTPA